MTHTTGLTRGPLHNYLGLNLKLSRKGANRSSTRSRVGPTTESHMTLLVGLNSKPLSQTGHNAEAHKGLTSVADEGPLFRKP